MLNKPEGRVLQPIQQIHASSKSNISKESDWKSDIESQRTIEALEILKEEEFLPNWSSFRNKENSNANSNLNNGKRKKVEASPCDKQSQKSQSSFKSNFSAQIKEVPEYDDKQDYYQLYWKTFIENQVILEKLRHHFEERNNYFKEMIKVSQSQCSMSQAEERKERRKKHIRRTAKEINKNQLCPYADCGKYYGSEGSLNLHMKLKHEGGNKTDREKLAKTLVLCYTNGKPYPEVSINLPPGALEEEARKLNVEFTPHQYAELQSLAESKFREFANKI